jgi:hypothetical protein
MITLNWEVLVTKIYCCDNKRFMGKQQFERRMKIMVFPYGIEI